MKQNTPTRRRDALHNLPNVVHAQATLRHTGVIIIVSVGAIADVATTAAKGVTSIWVAAAAFAAVLATAVFMFRENAGATL